MYILIIEDDISTNKLISRVLRDFKILSALTATEGLALAHAYNPCLIILDMNLPDISGWQLAAIIRSDPKIKNIPIIAASVQDDALYIQRALDAGCSEYFKKPFSIDDLRERVLHYIKFVSA